MDVEWVTPRLWDWSRDHWGPTATLDEIWAMPGNSGHSFGFQVTADGVEHRQVIRLPHPKARRTGNADVLRQSRVMAAAATAGVPVPPVLAESEDETWFGVPFYVVGLVHGRSTHLYDPAKSGAETGAMMEPVFREAATALAAIHAIPWEEALPSWGPPRTLREEIDKWIPTLRKAGDPAWIDQGLAVRELLVATCPDDPTPAVVHGDYYSNNWLFDDGDLVAVVDWEIASIGAPAIDVGWLLMTYDNDAWGPSRPTWSTWWPSRDFLVATYEEASGQPLKDVDWYQALACYRLACITARAYHLHTSGKRPDPAWDVLGEAFPTLLQRATALLQD